MATKRTKEPSDGRGTRVAGMVGPATLDARDANSLRAELKQATERAEAAEAANQTLAALLGQVADNLARLSCEIRARVKPQ